MELPNKFFKFFDNYNENTETFEFKNKQLYMNWINSLMKR